MKLLKIIAFAAVLLGVCVMAYAGVQLTETQKVYQEGNIAYDDISSIVRRADTGAQPDSISETLSNDNGATPEAMKEMMIVSDDYAEPAIDFDVLKTINERADSWLYSPGTVIDYPVMVADDYDYYLNHLPDGTVNANGSLFIDYNNAPDYSDPLTVIYGHHMKSGRMFGSLVGYKGQKYYEDHPVMYIYTEQGKNRLDLMYGCVIDAGQWSERAFMYSENIDDLLAYAAENTTFKSGVEYNEGDRIVALSTCSYEFDEARYVVLGILRDK